LCAVVQRKEERRKKKGEHTMTRKRHLLMWVFAIFAGMLFAVAPQVQGDDEGRVRFEGAWLVTNPIGIRFVETVSPIDPTGNRVAIHLTPISADATGMGCCPDADYLSVGIGEGVRTGPSTVEASILAYSVKTGALRDEIVCIWEMSVVSTFTEDTQDAAGILTIIPSIDENIDLLPDAGDEPCLQLPLGLTATRVP
jgi:hypothetical protein